MSNELKEMSDMVNDVYKAKDANDACKILCDYIEKDDQFSKQKVSHSKDRVFLDIFMYRAWVVMRIVSVILKM